MGNTAGNSQSSVAYDYQLFNVVLDNIAIADINLGSYAVITDKNSLCDN